MARRRMRFTGACVDGATQMPDIVIRDIDTVMAERIKQLAKERHWSLNDVVLHALRHGLRMISGNVFAETLRDADELTLSGHWDAAERAVFHEAVRALTATPTGPFATETASSD